MKLMELIKNNDVYEVLYERLKLNRVAEMNVALENMRKGINDGEVIDIIESTYEFNLQKLEETKELKNKGVCKRTKFINFISYIDKLPLNEVNTISTILTAGSILSIFDNDPEDLSDANLYLLSSSFISIPLKNYNLYSSMINNKLLDNITKKSLNYQEMRNVCYSLLDYCEMTDQVRESELESVADQYDYKNRLK